MADTTSTSIPAAEAAAIPKITPSPPRENRAAALRKLYALPAPLRTFPLPTLIPHNPISLFHVLYVWLSQTIRPPSSTLEVPYQGWWSPETRSVHVTDSRSIRGLWEQGFYGKGSLSRSEPSWLIGQKLKRSEKGKGKGTSEDYTKERRAARQQVKWERARKEREAIELRLSEEAEAALAAEAAHTADSISTGEELLIESDTSLAVSDSEGEPVIKAQMFFQSPVGPLELLSLPNSSLDLEHHLIRFNDNHEKNHASFADLLSSKTFFVSPVGPLQILALPNSYRDLPGTKYLLLEDHDETPQAEQHSLKLDEQPVLAVSKIHGNGSVHGGELNGHAEKAQSFTNGNANIPDESINGSVHSDDTSHASNFTPNGSALANGTLSTPKMKRQKNVRFSPTVEKTTFIPNEPPSPERAKIITTTIEAEIALEEEILEQEHFQLTLEEAFFLSYGLGALTILDPATKSPIANEKLFTLFRKSSYFPPLQNPSLSPDDPFMLNYVVYHHFRSLGWVVRGGIKFAVDLMLYQRGPVFTHAEFGVIILPSYTDPYWSSDVFLQNYTKGKEKRTWAWFHSIHRVINQAKKTLVLVYVDIPKPWEADIEKSIGIDGVLGRYKVTEVVMQRWVSNRQRD